MIKNLKFGTRTPGWFIIVFDLCISFVALIFAYLIRFDLNADINIFKAEWNKISEFILIFFILKFLVFYAFKIHKGLIRHTSNQDLKRLFFSLAVFTILMILLGKLKFHYIDHAYIFPTSILIIEFFVSLIILFGSRYLIKIAYNETIKIKLDPQNILVYGAGVSAIITKILLKTTQKQSKNHGFH